MNNIICVAGPTASGKTALAVELAQEFDGEVVSCDSMQIYKYMDIGTAKPTPDEMQNITHHMIDVAEPDEDFSVSRYCELATPRKDCCHCRRHWPLYGRADKRQRLCPLPLHRLPGTAGNPGGRNGYGIYALLAPLH